MTIVFLNEDLRLFWPPPFMSGIVNPLEADRDLGTELLEALLALRAAIVACTEPVVTGAVAR